MRQTPEDPFALLAEVDFANAPDPSQQMLMLPFWLRGGLHSIAFAIYLEAIWRQSRDRQKFLEHWAHLR